MTSVEVGVAIITAVHVGLQTEWHITLDATMVSLLLIIHPYTYLNTVQPSFSSPQTATFLGQSG